LGFRYATLSGLTISIDDVVTTSEKAAILNKYEAGRQGRDQLPPRRHRRRRTPSAGDRDLDERNKEVGDATDRAMNAKFDNPIRMMVDSGARGNSQQIRQIAAMKGLVSNRA